MNFEEDEDEVLDRLSDSLERLDHGVPVESVPHTPSPIHSNIFKKMPHNALGVAIADSGLSFLGGAPRNPNLMPGAGSEYSTVRYAEGVYAYTKITSTRNFCPDCGTRKMFLYYVTFMNEDASHQTVGTVGACRNCHPESWLFTTHMPKRLQRPFPEPSMAVVCMFLVVAIILVLISMGVA